MKVLRNTTREPIRVPLGGGHVLHLAPHGTGRIADRAADSKAVRALAAEGRVEIATDDSTRGPAGAGRQALARERSRGFGAKKTGRQHGDR